MPTSSSAPWQTEEAGWTQQDTMLIGLLEERFDIVYEELLEEGLLNLSDELQQRLRSVVLRELMAYFASENAETVCGFLDGDDTEPLAQALRDRIGRHILHPDILSGVPYDPEDPVVLIHIGLERLRSEREG